MTQQKGVTSQLLIGYESAYKTLATEGYVMPFNSEGVRPNQPLNQPGTISGTRNPTQPFGGNKDINRLIAYGLYFNDHHDIKGIRHSYLDCAVCQGQRENLVVLGKRRGD